MKVGTRVACKAKDIVGTVAFIGNTQFSEGKWIGVILNEPKGKNNGTVQGKRYFTCPDNHGLFLRPSQLEILDDAGEEAVDTNLKPPSSSIPAPASGNKLSGLKKPTSVKADLKSSSESLSSTVSVSSSAAQENVVAQSNKVVPTVSLSGGMIPATKSTVPPVVQSSPAPLIKGRDDLPATPPSTGLPRPNTLVDKRPSLSQLPKSSIPSLMEVVKPSAPPPAAAAPAAAADVNLVYSTTVSSNVDAALLSEKQQEIQNLKLEVADLSSKLESLEARRHEDRNRLKEYEKCKIQLLALEEYKKKMQEQMADVQKLYQQSKNECAQLQETYNRYREETQDLAEMIEIATVDKEMAEEKYDSLQAELQILKDRVEELQLENEILKEEESGKICGEGGPTLSQIKQQEQQNERMKQALVNLRELSYRDKQEITNLQKELTKYQTDVERLTKDKEHITTSLETAQRDVIELQEQVNAALGAEAMIEGLTEKNLSLEETVQRLTEERNDLEAINEMNDEMLETLKETELELKKDLDSLMVRESELMRLNEACRETVADRERALGKYRETVNSLNAIIEDLKKQNVSVNKQAEAAHAQNMQAAASSNLMDFHMKFAETKAVSKLIDTQMRQLDVEQGNQHVKFLLSFMSESFLKRGGDHDAVLLMLLVSRLNAKAGILATQLREKYPLPNSVLPNRLQAEPADDVSSGDALSTTAVLDDSLNFANYLIYQLNALKNVFTQFEDALLCCSVEQFTKFATLFPEVSSHESTLDQLLEQLRKDQLDENTSLDSLEKSLNYFNTLYQVHLANQEKLDCSKKMAALVSCLVTGSDGIILDTEQLLSLLKHEMHSGDEFVAGLQKLAGLLKEMKTSSRAIRRHLPDKPKQQPLTFQREVSDKIQKVIRDFTSIVCVVHMMTKDVRFSMPADQDETISIAEMKRCFLRAVQKHLQMTNAKSLEDSLLSLVQRVLDQVCQIADAMENGEYDFDGTKESPFTAPVQLRALEWKRELADLEATRARIEVKGDEVKELKMQLKVKQEELSVMSVRVGLAEKKLETNGRESDEKIDRLQQKLDQANAQLKRKEKEFEETMDALQADVDSLEKEKQALEQKLKTVSKFKLLEGLSNRSAYGASPPAAGTTATPGQNVSASTVDPALVSSEISSLRKALQHVLDENRRIKGESMKAKMQALPPLHIPQHKTDENIASFKKTLRDTQLQMNLHLVRAPIPKAGERLVEFEKRLAKYTLERVQLKDKLLNIQRELNKYSIDSGLLPVAPSDFGHFVQPGTNKSIRAFEGKETSGKLVATVELPAAGAISAGVHRVPLLSVDQLREVHAHMLMS